VTSNGSPIAKVCIGSAWGSGECFSTLTHRTQFEFTASTTAGRRISQLSQFSIVDKMHYRNLEIPLSGTSVRQHNEE
jgi:hypothetical protein